MQLAFTAKEEATMNKNNDFTRQNRLKVFTEEELGQMTGGQGEGASVAALGLPNTLDWLNRNRPLPPTPNIPRVATGGGGTANVNVVASGPPTAFQVTASATNGMTTLGSTVYSSPSPCVGAGVNVVVGRRF